MSAYGVSARSAPLRHPLTLADKLRIPDGEQTRTQRLRSE